jgi:hypothetical protein
VLVVVEHRDVQPILQPLLDLEAARRRDVLEVDAAEGRCDPADGVDDVVGGPRVEADGEPVDPGEVLEQQRLALHDRHGGLGADVAEAEDRGAVGDDGDGVLLDREVVDALGPRSDGPAHTCHARRVGHGEVVAVRDRHAGQHLDLAAVVHEEGAVRQLEHLASLEPVDGGPDPADVAFVAAVDDEVLLEMRAADVEAAQRGDVATGVAYCCGEPAE